MTVLDEKEIERQRIKQRRRRKKKIEKTSQPFWFRFVDGFVDKVVKLGEA